ncbi:MAG: CoA ester lyase [Gemmatimonadaceae bacterium]|nr:CoA ester lyase [Gemmatimonadaceae bacterium]
MPDRLSRSMLFVPGSRADMMAKAARSDADAVCLDLEDAVAVGQKEASRSMVVEALRTLSFAGRTRIVRVNALDTPFAYRDLVDVIEGAGAHLDLVMLPKTSGARDVQFVETLLTQIEARCQLPHRIGIEAQVETAAGFVALREIATSSSRLESLIFGSGDYAASMRMPLASIGEPDDHDAAYPGHRWHAAMHGIVAAARAFGLRCMDGPFANYRDTEGLARSAAIARAMGFDGKQCIHPAQLGTVNAAFSPGDTEVAHARAVIDAHERATAAGHGAIGDNGVMLDAANVRMARATLRAHDAATRRSGEDR